MPCTTILVGKNASYDGSTIAVRSEDSPSGIFNAKRFVVVKAEDQPRHYKSVLSGCELDLPDNPMAYTALPNSDPKEGIWGAAGINAANVAMTATETITTNPRVQGADPLIENGPNQKLGGLGEEDFVTVTLPYIHSAREGVKRLGRLLEEYGTYEMNGIAFQDVDEIWWLETIGGHHWMARRVPDDAFVVMPNQLGIDYFDFDDAYGAQENFMCSSDLKDWTEVNRINSGKGSDFNPRLAYGSHSVADHCYNTPRAWYILRYLAPSARNWDDKGAGYGPESDQLPWAQVPDRLVTLEDLSYLLSSHYQDTPYDPYQEGPESGKYRPIGVNRQNVTAYTQIRPYQPESNRAIQWLSFGSNAFNAVIPYYTNISKTPDYVGRAVTEPSTDNLYWTERLIAALADAHYSTCQVEIERYQDKILNQGHLQLNQVDHKFLDQDISQDEAQKILEAANQSMTDYTQKTTIQLLDRVLYLASNQMKNGYSRSDQ